ncbi:DUF6776 family protein [Bordetella sp. 15P40C-2]|uniref:DUF6776 family protein n=1 Tax=Bordetella sp. 15P40C-2 TaxID=2572246 RepID=UPI001324F060|nr:DUF6776 family protein [Bordetella sp. 15P40C-2]MVW73350.1 hypothetical protein [Bordetella sp. 15P40C-2]
MSSDPASPVRPASSRQWFIAIAAFVIGLAGGAWGGYEYARRAENATPKVVITDEQLAARDAAVQQSQAESRFLRAQLDTAEGEMAVERAARLELEAQLRAAQEELGSVRERLAFFEQLLPPGPEGTVDIRGAEVLREGAGLKYRVLLMRSGRPGSPFIGSLQFQATGVLKGEDVTLDLLPLQRKAEGTPPVEEASADSDPADALPVKFDQYQRSEGVLDLPEGFVPETVVVNVLEGTTVRASRTVKLPL